LNAGVSDPAGSGGELSTETKHDPQVDFPRWLGAG
jgi:hypothetical protein